MTAGFSFSDILAASAKGWCGRKADDALLSLALPLNGIDPLNARVVRIKNTLKLDEIYVSEKMLDDVSSSSILEKVSEASEMLFDSSPF